MHVQVRCSARLALTVVVAAVLAACGSFGSASHSIASAASAVTPYKVEVVQGNFVSREQVEALSPGMSRQQVRDILGTPLLTSVFHADRWEYVFTLKRPGVTAQTRKLTVFFEGDRLLRHEGDEMPLEADFVATLASKKVGGKVPVLEATSEQLARFPAPATPVTDNEQPLPDASSKQYPPLEAGGR
jgi:outer membrane protein assembly factor BamE